MCQRLFLYYFLVSFAVSGIMRNFAIVINYQLMQRPKQ